jgi:hypothetical protein
MEELDQLLDQLTSEDAKTRANAAKQLGTLERPEAIPRLVDVYQGDSDKNVRNAAADALKRYRAMESRVKPADDTPAPASPLLGRLRLLLIVVLVLSIVGNVVVFITKSNAGATPTPVVTDRAGIITIFQQRVSDAQASTKALRTYYTGVQGGADLRCADADKAAIKSLDVTGIDPGVLAPYLDLGPLNGQVNDMIAKVNSLRSDYSDLCALSDNAKIKDKINTNGGPGSYVSSVDSVVNGSIKTVTNSIASAISNPAPTITPTASPTELPTDTATPTVPTDTPAPTIPGATTVPTTNPAPGSTTKPGGSTAAATSAGKGTSPATLAPTNSNTITYDLSQIGLNTMTSFSYKIVVRYESKQPDGTVLNGSFQATNQQQTNPLVKQIDVNLTEGVLPQTFASPLKKTLGSLYVSGNSTYILQNNKLYEYGTILGQKPASQCTATAATNKVLGQIDAVNAARIFTRSDKITLTRKQPDEQVNNYPTAHYQGQSEANGTLSLIDVYISQETNPVVVRIVDTETYNYRDASGTLTPDKTLTIVSSYDLLKRNSGVAINLPEICKGK